MADQRFLIPVTVYSAAGFEDPSVRIRIGGWAERSVTAVTLKTPLDPFGLRYEVPPQGDETRIIFRCAAKASVALRETRLLRQGTGLRIYELDDGLPWDTGRLPGLGAWWKRPFRRDRIAQASASSADRVIAGNELLAEWASTLCQDVRIIPTCVDPDQYLPKTAYELSSPPRIVWIGSRATEFELDRVAPALAEVHKITGARLTVFGSPGPISPELAAFSTKVSWSLNAQSKVLAEADVGIMPLTNGVYQRAKCGYKLLQYAASALPSVASAVGVNRTMIDHGLAIEATGHDDWVSQLVDVLKASPDERQRLGSTAVKACIEKYAYETHELALRRALTG